MLDTKEIDDAECRHHNHAMTALAGSRRKSVVDYERTASTQISYSTRINLQRCGFDRATHRRLRRRNNSYLIHPSGGFAAGTLRRTQRCRGLLGVGLLGIGLLLSRHWRIGACRQPDLRILTEFPNSFPNPNNACLARFTPAT